MKLKVAEIGMGGISGAHVSAWKRMEDVELVAICDIRPEMMDRYDGMITARKYTDFDEMLANEQIDILDITLPTYLHVEYAIKAMEKGIHVVSEKPIALKREDVARAYDTASKNGKCFMIAQVLRWWPEYVYLKDCIDTGRYGKLVSGTMTRIGAIPVASWDNWMQDADRSGMVPFDLHIHDLDFLIYTMGKPEVEHVFHGMDYMHAVYNMDGARIACEAAWFHAPVQFSATFRMQFEHAVLEFNGASLKIYKEDWTTQDMNTGSAIEEGCYVPQSDGYYNELRYFVDCVKQGKFPEMVKPAELEAVIDTIREVYASK